MRKIGHRTCEIGDIYYRNQCYFAEDTQEGREVTFIGLFSDYVFVQQEKTKKMFSFRIFSLFHITEDIPIELSRAAISIISSIANYTSQLSMGTKTAIREKEVTPEDRYTFLLQSVKSSFACPYMEIPEVGMDDISDTTGLQINCVFDVVDEDSYKIIECTAGKVRFEKEI